VRGVFWSGIQQAGDRGLRMIVLSVLALLVAPEVLGLVALAMVFIDSAALLITQGLTAALVQRKDLTDRHSSTAFWVNLLVSLLLIAAMFVVAPIIGRWFDNPQLAPVLRVMSLGFLMTALSAVQDALLRRSLRFQALATRTLFSRIVGATVGITMAYGGYGAWSLVAMYLVNESIAMVILWSVSGWRPSLSFSMAAYRELLDFGWPMLGVQAMTIARLKCDDLIIAAMLGEATLGIYFLAKTLVSGIFSLIDGSIAPVVWSTFTRLQDQRSRLASAMSESAQLSAAIVLPAATGLIIVAPFVVGAAYGPTWLTCLPVIYALAVCRMIAATLGHNRTALTAIGRVDASFWLGVFATLGVLVGVAVGSRFGLPGIALGLVIAKGLEVPAEWLWIRRILPIDVVSFLKELSKPFIGSLLMFLGLWIIRDHLAGGWLSIGALIATGATFYGLFVLAAAPDLVDRVRSNLSVGISGS
jgi:PST family polysaccharide transporter